MSSANDFGLNMARIETVTVVFTDLAGSTDRRPPTSHGPSRPVGADG